MPKPEKREKQREKRSVRNQARPQPKQIGVTKLGGKKSPIEAKKKSVKKSSSPFWVWDLGADLGLIFSLITLAASYSLYQVNSFKLALLFVSLTSLLLISLAKKNLTPQKTNLLWVALPIFLLVSRLPGLALSEGLSNYNLYYELATGWLLVLWFYLCLSYLQGAAAQTSFLFFALLTTSVSSVWAIADWALAGGSLFPQSGFGHRNYMSSFLIMALPLALGLAKPWDNLTTNKTKTLALWAFGLGTMALFMAQTRAAIMAYLLGLLLFFVLRFWVEGKKQQFHQSLKIIGLLALILGVTAFGLWYFSAYLPKTRFLNLFSARAWIGRGQVWEAAWASFLASPYLGHGLGSSYNLFFNFVTPDSLLLHGERSYNHVHSEPLEILQEGGLLGLFAYLTFWFFTARKVWEGIQPNGKNPILALAVGVGLLSFFLHGLFSVAPRMIVVALPFFSLVALAFLLGENARPKKTPTATHYGFILGLLLVVGFLFIPWGYDQHRFMEARGKLYNRNPSTSLKGFYELETLGHTTGDIYALKLLLKEQMRRDHPKKAGAVASRIQEIIPHYQDVDFDQAVILILQQKMTESYGAAVKSQDRNRYSIRAIRLISSLAIEFNDYEQFERQIGLLLKKLPFDALLPKNWRPSGVQVFILSSSRELNFYIDEEDNLQIEFPKVLLTRLFEKAKEHRLLPKTLAKRKGAAFEQELSNIFGRDPFFRPKFRGDFIGEKESIFHEIKDFYQLEEEIVRLTQKRTSDPSEKLEAIILSKEVQSEALQENLNRKIYFEPFQARQKLATSLIKELSEILFPAPY
ncbi:MAG: O-antigen ligase family protein [SAR324 cluster bacterium]|nr:O-antigen ligase family protein [SAR324 cluster bacterium]